MQSIVAVVKNIDKIAQLFQICVTERIVMDVKP